MESSQTILINQSPIYLEFNFQGTVKRFILKGEVITFGRASDVDLILDGDEWAVISRYHATLIREGETYSIYDGVGQGTKHQSSRNGLLHGHRRIGMQHPHLLKDGDELRLVRIHLI